MTIAPVEPPEFEYAIEVLPPSRIGRRWRYELWQGASLLAAGWRLSPLSAERAVRVAALRRVHARKGVVPLPSALDGNLHGSTVFDRVGRAVCVLRRREPDARSARSARAA